MQALILLATQFGSSKLLKFNMRFYIKKRLTKRKKGKNSKWGMPGAAQMEKYTD